MAIYFMSMHQIIDDTATHVLIEYQKLCELTMPYHVTIVVRYVLLGLSVFFKSHQYFLAI